MKTALAIIQDLRKLLLPAEASLSGGTIRQYNRITGSKTNDVVLNILGASNDYMQFAIANINIHCPNPSYDVPNSTSKDNTQPNLALFNTLASLIIPMVKHVIKSDYKLELRNDNGLIRDSDGSWYYNIQVNYYSIQESSTA